MVPCCRVRDPCGETDCRARRRHVTAGGEGASSNGAVSLATQPLLGAPRWLASSAPRRRRVPWWRRATRMRAGDWCGIGMDLVPDRCRGRQTGPRRAPLSPRPRGMTARRRGPVAGVAGGLQDLFSPGGADGPLRWAVLNPLCIAGRGGERQSAEIEPISGHSPSGGRGRSGRICRR